MRSNSKAELKNTIQIYLKFWKTSNANMGLYFPAFS